jgi:hypothetical protein
MKNQFQSQFSAIPKLPINHMPGIFSRGKPFVQRLTHELNAESHLPAINFHAIPKTFFRHFKSRCWGTCVDGCKGAMAY